MAYKPRLAVLLGGDLVPVTSMRLTQSAGSGTVAALSLQSPVGTVPAETGSWSVGWYYDVAGTLAGAVLLAGGHVGEDSVSRDRDRPVSLESVTVLDPLSAFRDLAPTERIVHKGTTLAAELDFVASRLDASFHGETNLPPIPIDEIAYSRDASYLSALDPYYALFEPWVFVDHRRNVLRVVDPLSVAIIKPITIRPTQARAADLTVDSFAVVTQVKLSVQPSASGADDEERAIAATRRTTAPEESIDELGNRTVSWDLFDDLHEEGADPSRVTRSIPRGSVVETYVADANGRIALASRQTTELRYSVDYSRILSSTSIEDGIVDLPVIGRVFLPRVKVTEEAITYTPDPDQPRRKIRKTREVKTYGIVIYTGSVYSVYQSQMMTNSVPPPVDAVMAKVATESGSVDTRVESAQSYAEDVLCSTLLERYTPAAHDQLSVSGVETNWLRGVGHHSYHRSTIARSSVASEPEPIVEYRPPVAADGAFRNRAALSMDASYVGLDHGRYLADRKIALSGTPRRGKKVTLFAPNPEIAIADPVILSGWGLGSDGVYLVESIEYSFSQPSGGGAPTCSQVLTLVTT